ncbi:pyridoxamine 5'-phosphate oxidase family protein [Micromonospora sp. NPDC049060]|uniref:pyridoxamine 5'-phosphate oxidase family protein n=1 Tax=Micromonospora sp. NPDC049060 TaxID=3154828 RepID=UPI0033EF7A1B
MNHPLIVPTEDWHAALKTLRVAGDLEELARGLAAGPALPMVAPARRVRHTQGSVATVDAPIAELLFQPEDATPFSTDAATLKPWSQALACLRSAPRCWLSTVRPDGHPHAAPVLLVLVDGVACVASRPNTRKSRNLARNPHGVIMVGNEDLDLVVKGEVHRVSGDTMLRRMAAAFGAKYRWSFDVRDGRAYDGSLPGSPEYAFYQICPVQAFGYGADGMTATRWRFDRASGRR